jgi:hypothetical protein
VKLDKKERGRPRVRDEEEIKNLRNVNFRADKEFVKALRLFCVGREISMQDFIKQAIQEKMDRTKQQKKQK